MARNWNQSDTNPQIMRNHTISWSMRIQRLLKTTTRYGSGTWMIQRFASKSKCHPRALKISWITASVLALEQSAFYRLNSMLPHPRPMFYPSGNVSNHRNTLAWKWQSTHELWGWKEYQTEVMSKIHSPELSSVGTWKSRFPSFELPLLQLKLRIWKLCRSESTR